jgi:HK97 gp10 family phage protein
MAGLTTYQITDRTAPLRVVDPSIGRTAGEIMRAAQARTPVRTGRLRSSWRVVKSATSHYRVINTVPYARFVEHGTSDTPAHPMLGPAILTARQRYGR